MRTNDEAENTGDLNVSQCHTFSVRIYYEDTDFSGNVYHAAYLKFMERGRTEFLRERGVHHSQLLVCGLVFAVRKLDITYDQPARIDDALEVVSTLVEIRGARLVLEQLIRRNDDIIARARVVIAVISTKGRPRRLPADVVKKLSGDALRDQPGLEN